MTNAPSLRGFEPVGCAHVFFFLSRDVSEKIALFRHSAETRVEGRRLLEKMRPGAGKFQHVQHRAQRPVQQLLRGEYRRDGVHVSARERTWVAPRCPHTRYKKKTGRLKFCANFLDRCITAAELVDSVIWLAGDCMTSPQGISPRWYPALGCCRQQLEPS